MRPQTWLAAAIGASLAYFFDPGQGRMRRAAVLARLSRSPSLQTRIPAVLELGNEWGFPAAPDIEQGARLVGDVVILTRSGPLVPDRPLPSADTDPA